VTDIALPRVGHIGFLNCLPLYWGLQAIGADAGMRLLRDTPDHLSDALVAGDLDIGPISLIEALRNADDLLVLPEVAVGSDGPVRSVCLVSRRPLADLEDALVALGSTSRTSVLLARLVLEQVYGLHPRYLKHVPDLQAMLEVADAAVLIGDPALHATLVGAPEAGWHVLDLGQAWREWTDLPMVFAVWAVRRDYALDHPESLAKVRTAFARALGAASDHRDLVVTAASATTDYPRAAFEDYFSVLDFSLGDRQLAGIERFGLEIAGAGLASVKGRLTVLPRI